MGVRRARQLVRARRAGAGRLNARAAKPAHAVAHVMLTVLFAALAFAAGGAAAELDGSWTVARIVFEGTPRADGKLLNATWTFRGSELLAQSANGERLRAQLSFDSTTQPPAVYVSPIDDPQQRPLWMIWVRQGDELRVAFYDGLDARPVDFGPRRKLVVVTLVPARGAPVALDPCHILRAADVNGLLGGSTQPRSTPSVASDPGSTCALDRTDGSRAISLTLIGAPAGAAYVDAARQEAADEAWDANRRGARARCRRLLGRQRLDGDRGRRTPRGGDGSPDGVMSVEMPADEPPGVDAAISAGYCRLPWSAPADFEEARH